MAAYTHACSVSSVDPNDACWEQGKSSLPLMTRRGHDPHPDVVANTIPLGRTMKLRNKTSFIYHRASNSDIGFRLF